GAGACPATGTPFPDEASKVPTAPQVGQVGETIDCAASSAAAHWCPCKQDRSLGMTESPRIGCEPVYYPRSLVRHKVLAHGSLVRHARHLSGPLAVIMEKEGNRVEVWRTCCYHMNS